MDTITNYTYPQNDPDWDDDLETKINEIVTKVNEIVTWINNQ